MLNINQYIKHNNRLFDIYSAQHIDLDGIKFSVTYFVDDVDGLVLTVPNQEESSKLLNRIPWISRYLDESVNMWPNEYKYSMKNIYSSEHTDTVTSLYLSICELMLKSTKKWNTYQHSEDYSLEFDVSNMDDNVINIRYSSTEGRITISYHDGKEPDDFFGDINKYEELVDEHYTGLTSSQGKYVFDHVLVFDTY